MKVRDDEIYDAATLYLVEEQQRGIRVFGDPRGVDMVKLHKTASGRHFCFTSTKLPQQGASIVMWNCEVTRT